MKDELDKTLSEERLRFVGKQMEQDILSGEEVILKEVDRVWLKESLEAAGVDLGVIKESGGAEHQAARLVEALGVERTLELVTKTVKEIVELDGGSVYQKESGEPEGYDLEGFVRDFVGSQLSEEQFSFAKDKFKSIWKANTVYRIEAVMSGMNRVMFMAGAADEEDGRARQESESVLHRLRERVLRGMERKNSVISGNVKRYEQTGDTEKDADYRRKIKHIPRGGMEIMMKNLSAIKKTEETEV